MESDEKVFFSKISKANCNLRSDLYDLLIVEPAKPILEYKNKDLNVQCEFTPKSDKYYIPKKTSTLKVKTVRDIRSAYEQDVYSNLSDDLEKQKSYLLRKIREGKSASEHTKTVANKMLNTDYPISRSAWQMIININPENHPNPKQFVKWKNKLIQVNGSKGGKHRIISNCNLDTKNISICKRSRTLKKPFIKKHNQLLKNSLEVKFKPGPLCRKKSLDDSYQKHLGSIDLVKLPKPVLEIQPAYGTVLDSTITHFLNNLRERDGHMTKNWAEFAVSVLGTVNDKGVKQTDKETWLTFDLNYNRNRKSILMRQDLENITINNSAHVSPECTLKDSEINLEVKNVIDNLVNAVEISLIQDSVYSTNDNSVEFVFGPSTEVENIVKDKNKKKFNELSRLDVTVIKLPETETIQHNSFKPCDKPYCCLGCICDSLNNTFKIQSHCGLLECMFECKCEIPRYKDIEVLEDGNSEILPGLINLDNKITSRLAKEEQKFHQTVILSGKQSILLKSEKRNRKSTKRYAEFCSNSNISTKNKRKKVLTILETKINCENIEPWCMVHNLYKCFCKGKFTHSSMINEALGTEETKSTSLEPEVVSDVIASDDDYVVKLRSRNRNKRIQSNTENKNEINIASTSTEDFSTQVIEETSCARIDGYKGRKYTDGYYKHTHGKMLQMEKNDSLLQKKMLKLINISEDSLSNDSRSSDSVVENATLNVENTSEKQLPDKQLPEPKPSNHKNLLYFGPNDNKEKLIQWLETSYKIYKDRLDRGIVKNSLCAPAKGKLALHPWDFILSRYRERKNLFLVTQQKPFRIYLAVNNNSSFFDNCLNIDDIRFADLNKYPVIIKNLLTNATNLKNNFCILGGWAHCWELVGSVTKMYNEDTVSESRQLVFDDENISPQPSLLNENEVTLDMTKVISDDLTISEDKPNNDITERSKWFLMTLENDFSEIQFYKRGFYVKHGSIVHAIELARLSGKTVRLSSQTCNDKISGPQFGIYAVPNTSQFCVFVGPYEIDESLGIETVKNLIATRKLQKTRGVWIVTNKVDDMQVINNPLSFIPSKSEQSEMMLALGSNYNIKSAKKISTDSITFNEIKIEDKTPEAATPEESLNNKPIIKPIKIQRNGLIQILDLNNIPNTVSQSVLKPISKPLINLKQKVVVMPIPLSDNKTPSWYSKPVTAVTLQPNLRNVSLDDNIHSEQSKNFDSKKGMFILKPEEINKKILQTTRAPASDSVGISNDMDVEKFLEISNICSIPDDEILVLSDDDIEQEENDSKEKTYQRVWIQSTIDKLGWIPGRKFESKISFEFPGFTFSEFYPEREAIKKINQVLTRKIYVPKNMKVDWIVLENKRSVKGKMLTTKCLKQKGILTKNGIEDFLLFKKKNIFNINSKRNKPTPSTSTMKIDEDSMDTDIADIEVLEDMSQSLDDENEIIWNKTISKKNQIISSLNITDEHRTEMTDALQKIIELNDSNDGEGDSDISE